MRDSLRCGYCRHAKPDVSVRLPARARRGPSSDGGRQPGSIRGDTMRLRVARTAALTLVLILALGACGNSGDDDDSRSGTVRRHRRRRSSERRPQKNVPVHGARRDRHEIDVAVIASKTNNLERQVRRARRRHQGLLQHGQRQRRDLRPQANRRSTTATTSSASEPAAGAGRAWRRTRRSRRSSRHCCSPAPTRSPGPSSRRSSGTSTPSSPGTQRLRQRRRDLLQLRRASRSRSSPSS